MCGTCGCSDPENMVVMTDLAREESKTLRQDAAEMHALLHDHGHDHSHGHDHHHHHDHDEPHVHGPNGEVISLEQAVLAKNDSIAQRNRGWFEGRGVLALNLVSSPGAGKTSLLERSIEALKDRLEIAVIEGDQMTTNDAERIRAAGAKAIQINTGAGCHLEADMIASALEALNPKAGSLLLIENVGNLVCPAMFDLGERMKVAIISTTEGEDKPLKYPHMFRAAEVVIINKMDLAPHTDFDLELCSRNIREVNPKAQLFEVSSKTGAGMAAWLAFLQEQQRALS